MNESSSCPHCGAPLKHDAPQGVCPRCLVALGIALNTPGSPVSFLEQGDVEDQPDAGVAPAPASDRGLRIPSGSPPGRFGDYELLEEIGRGGMGVVFKAKQFSLNRIVALKMILAGQLATKEMVLRFRAEAEAVANLRHPHIVAIYETGEIEGQHYFSMDYVAGRDLAELVREAGFLPAVRAVQYVQKIALAVEYAHQRGLLHRDLKPSNVLIDEQDEPRVMDFGLAKKFTAESGLTLSGQLLGSPNFVPPEQASSQRGKVGRHSDVYGLGALLYHLLTGRPPFQAQTLEETLQQVFDQEPVTPRILNPSVPVDLETICLKCLEKDPQRRYVTAQAVADELGRFLRHEPVQARPVSPAEKLWRWCRRKPMVAGLVASLQLVLILGAVLVLWQWRRAEMRGVVLERNVYAGEMLRAVQAWENDNVSLVQELLEKYRPRPGEEDLRGFEWRYLWRLCHSDLATLAGHTRNVSSIAFSADGTTMATASADGAIKLWDFASLRELGAFSGHNDRVEQLAFLPGGGTLASASAGSARIWDLTTHRELAVLTNKGWPRRVSPDGKLLAVAGPDQALQLWEVTSGRQLSSFAGLVPKRYHWGCNRLAFSNDGQHLAVSSESELVTLLSVSGLGLVASLSNPKLVEALAFSPDSRLLAAGLIDGTIQLWGLGSNLPMARLQGKQTGPVTSMAFSPDSRRLASGTMESTVALWNLAGRRELLAVFKGHLADVHSVAFSPDGKVLASGGWHVEISPHGAVGSSGGAVKLWDATPKSESALRVTSQAEVWRVAFSPDSRLLAASSNDGGVTIFDAVTEEPVAWLGPQNRLNERLIPEVHDVPVAFSPDGRMLTVGNGNSTATLWEVASRRPLASFTNHTNLVRCVAFAAGAQVLATGSGRAVKLWNFASGQEVRALTTERDVWAVAFSPDGKLLAAGTRGNLITLWVQDTGTMLRRFQGPSGPNDWVWSLAFSPDGRILAAGDTSFKVWLWDVRTWALVGSLTGVRGPVSSVAFSPDGRNLAACGFLGTIKLWNLASLQEVGTLAERLPSGAIAVAFSPDGNALAVGSRENKVRLFRAASFAQTDAEPRSNP